MCSQGRQVARHRLQVQEHKRLLGLYGYLLVHRVAAVFLYPVHADKPAVLTVGYAELAVALLDGGRAHRHVVRHRIDGTGIAHADVALLARAQLHAQQHAAVGSAHHVLQQLALAAAGGALVHHHHLVLIGRDDARGGGVGRHPALALADVQQHAVNALLGGGAGVEVVGEHLVQLLAAAVDDHLLAAEARVAEGRGHIDDRPRREVLHLADVHKGLQLAHGKGEEGRVARADEHGVVAVVIAAGLEGHQHQLLARQPVERDAAQVGEFVAVDLLKAGLVGGQVVADAHAVRVAPAHIVLREVDGGAVFAAHDLRFLDAAALHVVGDLYLIRVLVAEDELEEHLLAGGDDDAGTVVDDLAQLIGEGESLKEYVHICLAFRAQARKKLYTF